MWVSMQNRVHDRVSTCGAVINNFPKVEILSVLFFYYLFCPDLFWVCVMLCPALHDKENRRCTMRTVCSLRKTNITNQVFNLPPLLFQIKHILLSSPALCFSVSLNLNMCPSRMMYYPSYPRNKSRMECVCVPPLYCSVHVYRMNNDLPLATH